MTSNNRLQAIGGKGNREVGHREEYEMNKGKAKVIVGAVLLAITVVFVVIVPWIQKLRWANALHAGATHEEQVSFIAIALFSTAVGYLIGLVGSVILIIGIVQLRKRKAISVEPVT